MELALHAKLSVKRLPFQSADPDFLPDDVQNIGQLPWKAQLLANPENILLADGRLEDVKVGVAVFDPFLVANPHRRLFVVELRHVKLKADNTLDAELA